MLYKIEYNFPNDIIFEVDGPLISLYQPTHKHFPENKQDPIVFKNLLRKIENSLKRAYKNDIIQSIMKPFYQIEEDMDKQFWNNTLDGIAILASTNKCIVYNLQSPVKEFAVVADSFHIKPLIQAFQSLDRYQLLGLSRNSFNLFQGNRYGFSEISISSDIPRALEEVLGKQLTDPNLTQGSHGGAGKPAIYHSHGNSNEEIDKDTEKYYRYVDRFVLENYSKLSKLPLILVSLMENHTLFKKISHNPYLIEEGINNSYESFAKEQLEQRALEIIAPFLAEKVRKLTESYERAKVESSGSADLAQIVKAAFEGRVETVMIEEDRIIPGEIDNNTGEINLGDIDDPDCDDIIDDLAELVLKNGGEVVVFPKEKMPSLTGVAAIYRYN